MYQPSSQLPISSFRDDSVQVKSTVWALADQFIPIYDSSQRVTCGHFSGTLGAYNH